MSSPSLLQVILAALLALFVGAMGPATAAADRAPARYNAKLKVNVTPLVLTTSGGVSLGSYQAGLLYYSLRHLKNYGLFDPRVVTGASAGSVNGLISIVEGCGDLPQVPHESLFWKTWIPLGLDQLVLKDQITPTTLMSRERLHTAIEAIRKKWMAGISTQCDVVFGVTATRKFPLIEEVRPGLAVQRYSETFVIRIRGRGKGVPPHVENFPDPERMSILLPFGTNADRNFDLVRDVVFASTAVPLAFPPQPVRHCIQTPGGRVPGAAVGGCDDATSREDLFIDGGVFDNVPMRLSHRLASLRMGGTPDHQRIIYGFASVDNESYPARREERKESPGILPTVARMWGDFISTARGREVSAVFDESPAIRSRILANVKHLPLAGEHLTDFLGFIEGDFRRFDFYLGMYDGRYTVKEGILKQGLKTVLTDAPLKLPEDLVTDRWEWKPVSCLVQYIELPEGEAGERIQRDCADYVRLRSGAETNNYRALLQASMNLLYSRCQGSIKPDPNFQPLCRKVFETRADPPRIVESFDPTTWRPLPDESDFQYFMRILGRYGFHFKDLGLDPVRSRHGMKALESKISILLNAAADQQSFGQGLFVRITGLYGLKSVLQGPTVAKWYLGIYLVTVVFALALAALIGTAIVIRLRRR